MVNALIALLLIGGLVGLYLYSQGKLPIPPALSQLLPIISQSPTPYSQPQIAPLPQLASTLPSASPSPVLSSPGSIPSAASIYDSETLNLPPTVKGVIIEIPNEAHEPTPQQRMGPKNGEFLPLNIVMSAGTSLAVLNGDAGHTHTVNLGSKAGGSIPYTGTALFPSVTPGTYEVVAGGIARHAKLTVNPTPASGNTTIGIIYVPTDLVPKFKTAFTASGFSILSEHSYAWKVGRIPQHTVLVYSTTQDIQAAVDKLPPIARMLTYT